MRSPGRRSGRIVLVSGVAVALFDAWRALAADAKKFDVITVDLRLSGLAGRAFLERTGRRTLATPLARGPASTSG
jgi:hypothetical protein